MKNIRNYVQTAIKAISDYAGFEKPVITHVDDSFIHGIFVYYDASYQPVVNTTHAWYAYIENGETLNINLTRFGTDFLVGRWKTIDINPTLTKYVASRYEIIQQDWRGGSRDGYVVFKNKITGREITHLFGDTVDKAYPDLVVEDKIIRLIMAAKNLDYYKTAYRRGM